MKQQVVSCAALLCAVCLLQIFNRSSATPAQDNSIKASNEISLSTPEQDVLNEVNQARLHPSDYASYLEGLKPFFKGREYTPKGRSTLMTNEGWDAVEDAIRFLRAAKPQPALTVSNGLCLAALAHVKDQSGTGATGHKGANNGLIEERLRPYGMWQGGVGENLSYGNESARERVVTWLIDDGVSTRGHRTRLLSADYKVAGLSCGPHPEYGTMCVVTLAGGFVDQKAQPVTNPQTKAPTNTQTKTPTSPKTKTKRTARRV